MSVDEISKKMKIPPEVIHEFLGDKSKESIIEKKLDAFSQITITGFKDIFTIAKENKIMLAVFAIFVLIVYFNSFFNYFVSDDIPGFVNLTSIRNFWASMATLSVSTQIYAIVYNLFGANAAVMHIVSAALHAYTTILLFLVVYIIFGEKPAVVTSFLYATHPLNTEAVVWMSANGYLFTGIATLTTFLGYLIYKKTGKTRDYIISVLIYIICISIFRNPLTLMIPILLLVLDQAVLEKRINFKSALKLAPYYLAVVAYYFLYLRNVAAERIHTLQTVFLLKTSNPEPAHIRVPYTISKVWELLIYPRSLTFYHEGDLVTLKAIYIVTGIFIAAIIFFWFKDKRISGLLMMIPIGILPSFSPVQVAWFVAERYLYVPIMFFCILLALLLVKVETKIKVKNLAIFVTILIVAGYSVRTVFRNADWKNERTLWLATADVSPYSPQIFNNLGDLFYKDGDMQKSLTAYKRAIELYPTYAAAYHNMGNTYLSMKDYENAAASFAKAVELNPVQYQSWSNLGITEYRRGNFLRAKKYFMKALEIKPDINEALAGLDAVNKLSPEQQQDYNTGSLVKPTGK